MIWCWAQLMDMVTGQIRRAEERSNILIISIMAAKGRGTSGDASFAEDKD